MPAEFVEASCDSLADQTHRKRRQRRLFRGIHGVPRQTGDTHHPIILSEVRFQRVVVDRPVVGNAIEGFHFEVGGMQARKVSRVEDGAAADPIEVDHRHRRVFIVDGVVSLQSANVGI